jgi:hypothetical protein
MPWEDKPEYFDLAQLNQGEQFTPLDAPTPELFNAIVNNLQYIKNEGDA